jgi:hypothetical protein
LAEAEGYEGRHHSSSTSSFSLLSSLSIRCGMYSLDRHTFISQPVLYNTWDGRIQYLFAEISRFRVLAFLAEELPKQKKNRSSCVVYYVYIAISRILGFWSTIGVFISIC